MFCRRVVAPRCPAVQSAWAARGFACLRVCCSVWVVFSRRLLAWCYVRFSCTPRFVAGRVVGEGVMTRHHVRPETPRQVARTRSLPESELIRAAAERAMGGGAGE